MLFRRRTKYREHELAPDEIFLDATNLPAYDEDSLEGRLEKPISRASFFGFAIFICLVSFTLVAQAAKLQIINGDTYALRSENNRLRPELLFAERGAILDRNGVALVSNGTDAEGNILRIYETPGFSHLLGYISYPKKDSKGNWYETDIKGLAGVELQFDLSLMGENGRLLIEEDALGAIQSQGSVIPAKNGIPLSLSIDARAQKALYTAISGLADKIPYQGGSGILMDVETGQVHALVSYPEYNSNILSKGTERSVIASYNTDSRRPYLDRAVSGLYTPGSIIKPLGAIGALVDGIITPETTITSTGSISIPNPFNPSKPSIFKDWKVLGSLDLRHAIAWSSNVYFYTIGGGYGNIKGLGIERLAYWYKTFGLDTPTGIELPREAKGLIPTPQWKLDTFDEKWNIGNTYYTAIGQYGMQITPLEAARAIAAVANGGKLVKPTILKDGPLGGTSISIDPEALKVAREGMRLGATEGTSVGLNDLSFVKIAGKTGTAQLGVNNEFYNSWSVGFFPYDKPKYVYVVVMERGPAGNGVGGIYVMHQFLRELHQTAPEYFDE